ncbi:MAG: thiamine-phosphate kinase [Hyphomicrobium sp.]
MQTYLAPLAAGYPGAFGLADDAALITVPAGHDLVASTDPIIAGVHFFPTDRADDIAWKALAVNVSDLIAKGAEPKIYTMALAFPDAPERGWMASFAHGLGEAQRAFGCTLIGGDTDRTRGPLSISITALGTVPRGAFIRRGAVQAGDHAYVSGTLGDAAMGLALHRDHTLLAHDLASGDRAFLVGRYLRPNPRVALVALLRRFAVAAMDVSDGLGKDLRRLAGTASIDIAFADLPLSPPARHVIAADAAFVSAVVAGGDDYEVLFAVADAELAAFEEAVRAMAAPVRRIGRFVEGQGVTIRDGAGRPIDLGLGGYDHMSPRPR